MIFRTRSIGIDIQPRRVRIAVVAQQGGRLTVLNLIEREVPETSEQEGRAATASIIRQIFEENKLDGDACVACLPAASSINRILKMPITDAGKILKTLKFQLEPQVPYPVEQIISDFLTIRIGQDGAEVLAIAVAKEHISERLDVLKMAGVDPQVLTLDALALTDFFMDPFVFTPDKITALLRRDQKAAFLGFFVGERLVGYRYFDALASGDEAASQQLVKELRRSLIGFQASAGVISEIGTLCVAGPDAEDLQRLLQASFHDFPVRTVEFNARAVLDIPPALQEKADYQLAIALAYVGLGASANAVNFRQEEYAPVPLLERLKLSIFFSLGVAAIALIAWFGSLLAQTRHQSIELESFNREMLKIFADTMPGVQSSEAAQQKIKEEQEKFKLLRHYSSQYISPLDVLAAAASSVPDQKNLTLNDFSISENVLRMTGEVDSFDKINAFQGRLEASPLLSEIKIDSATKADKGDKVNFRIRARVAHETGAHVASQAEGTR